jgi:tripartite-type tricarboxylate transporter receptor subunit TctC
MSIQIEAKNTLGGTHVTKPTNGTTAPSRQSPRPIDRRTMLGGSAAALAAFATSRPSAAQAASLPAGPITIVIPTAAGGQADIIGRLIGNRMSEVLSRPVIIEPKPGGGGLFAGQAVATAPPDGSTLLL